ncbi:MAG: regulator SirB [Betaproteobacteria bacterium]|nr:MAG: regulator SirB [Betaproteobacteria bacterium]
MDYAVLKLIHVSCVVTSYALFVVRGVWMMRQSPLLGQRWIRVIPHLVDTMLLASAVAMAVMTRQYPFGVGWLTAKLLALVCYIGLGMIALKRGSTRGARIAAWVSAQAVFFYIVAVAITRNPLPWTAGI